MKKEETLGMNYWKISNIYNVFRRFLFLWQMIKHHMESASRIVSKHIIVILLLLLTLSCPISIGFRLSGGEDLQDSDFDFHLISHYSITPQYMNSILAAATLSPSLLRIHWSVKDSLTSHVRLLLPTIAENTLAF